MDTLWPDNLDDFMYDRVHGLLKRVSDATFLVVADLYVIPEIAKLTCKQRLGSSDISLG
jgi:hypothetical protein